MWQKFTDICISRFLLQLIISFQCNFTENTQYMLAKFIIKIKFLKIFIYLLGGNSESTHPGPEVVLETASLDCEFNWSWVQDGSMFLYSLFIVSGNAWPS